jgi:rhodanese-related sulfurtransferase
MPERASAGRGLLAGSGRRHELGPNCPRASSACEGAKNGVPPANTRLPGASTEYWHPTHIHGSLNLPLTQLASRLHGLPNDKPVVAVCASGHRSALAARTLQRAGYQAENLKGGMHAWTRAGLPLQSDRSKPR